MIQKIDTTFLSAVEVYKLVLDGRLNRFPLYFWEKPNSMDDSKKILLWLFEEKLKMNDEDIKNKVSVNFFQKNKLLGMIKSLFNSSPFQAIDFIYPNRFKPWELSSTTLGYWTLETGIQATKWLIEEKLHYDEEQIKDNLSIKLFTENHLGGMLQRVFGSSPYSAINAAYPNKFKPWEIPAIISGYWNIETGIQATKWLVEEKLHYDEEQIKDNLSIKLFKENGLGGMLQRVFRYSAYNAINTAYPNKFKPWEFKACPNKYWDIETAKQSIKWLIEEKLNYDENQIRKNASKKLFKQNGLAGMLQKIFNDSPSNAINAVYPNMFKK